MQSNPTSRTVATENTAKAMPDDLVLIVTAVENHCGVCITDGSGQVLRANGLFAEICDERVAALEGKSFPDLLVNGPGMETIDKIWSDAKRDNSWKGRLKFKTLSGSVRDADATISSHGALTVEDSRFVILANDVSNCVEMEKSLAKANVDLDDMAKIQSNFLAAMSHDLRTPLNSIIGFTDIINQELFGPVENERYADYLESVNGSAKHLLTLVNDILDFSIMEATGYKFQLERYDPVAQTMVIARTFDWIAREKSLRIDVSGGSRAPETVLADPRVATQIQTNLITNACRHSPPGGLVQVVWDRNDTGDVFFEITNEGDPIPDEIIEGFGRPFLIRNPMHASNTEKSYGLGLYICHRFIQARGGTLAISRNNGVGARVRATWPAAVLKPEPA